MTNMGWYDRALRIAIGSVIVSFAFWGPQNQGLLLFLGLVASGIVGFCPLYRVLGANTK